MDPAPVTGTNYVFSSTTAGGYQLYVGDVTTGQRWSLSQFGVNADTTKVKLGSSYYGGPRRRAADVAVAGSSGCRIGELQRVAHGRQGVRRQHHEHALGFAGRRGRRSAMDLRGSRCDEDDQQHRSLLGCGRARVPDPDVERQCELDDDLLTNNASYGHVTLPNLNARPLRGCSARSARRRGGIRSTKCRCGDRSAEKRPRVAFSSSAAGITHAARALNAGLALVAPCASGATCLRRSGRRDAERVAIVLLKWHADWKPHAIVMHDRHVGLQQQLRARSRSVR